MLAAVANQTNWTRSDADQGNSNWATSMTVTPVPEPKNYAMLLAGLGLMGFIARRRSSR